MMQKIMLIGNLGQDPRKAESAKTTVVNFSVAVTEGYGEHKFTEWFNCVAFGKRGDFVAGYAKKGARVYVEGKLQTNKYTSKKDGTEKQSLQLIVDEVKIISGGKSNNDVSTDTDADVEDTAGESAVQEEDIPF